MPFHNKNAHSIAVNSSKKVVIDNPEKFYKCKTELNSTQVSNNSMPKPLNLGKQTSFNLGLTDEEVLKRRRIDGLNILSLERKMNPLSIFFGQFKDLMVIILLAATVVSVLLGEVTDAVTIIMIVLVNAILGFVQEFRTEKTLEALTKMTAPTAKCYRNGVVKIIPAAELVCGDVIELESGDRVPADAKLLAVMGLFVDESILTGEAVTVQKSLNSGKTITNKQNDDLDLGEISLLYAGTIVTKGHCKAEIIATGLNSQMGKISGLISNASQEQTPLQKRLGELGRVVAVLCIAVCAVVFVAGVLRGEEVFSMLLTGISIAIAAIPEGLPATVTIALALAVNRMLVQNALVNRLHSVETLGCTSVICTDKTGTLTENRMTVQKIWSGETWYGISGNGYRCSGEISDDNGRVNPVARPSLKELFVASVLCGTAKIWHSNTENSENATNSCVVHNSAMSQRDRGSLEVTGEWQTSGDPTEIALLVAAAKGGVTFESLERELKIFAEQPFDSETRMMSVACRKASGQPVAFSKGAVDVILASCSFFYSTNGVKPLTLSMKRRILENSENMAFEALRVLGFACKDMEIGESLAETSSHGMIFLGMVGMIDPPRAEAKRAVRVCRNAHIKTVMITGDHPATAAAIAKKVGILPNDYIFNFPEHEGTVHNLYINNSTKVNKVMTGKELEKLCDEDLDSRIQGIQVFARVSPGDKLRIVKSLKKCGYIVTMTGDGVNDAPAIKEAHVGVSMGKSGTDVAKQAADMILLDDNFATLVSAVRQGRTVYANIRKFVRYMLSCNIGEVITMFLGIIFGMPLILMPTQILLVNLVTDGLPAIALGVEPPEERIMSQKPRSPDESFFSGGLLQRIIFRGILIGLSTLGCFVMFLAKGGTVEMARTGALFTLVTSQLIHVFECKSEYRNIFTAQYFSNIKLILAVILSGIIVLSAIYITPLQMIFSTVSLTGIQLLTALGFSVAVPILYALFGGSSRK